LECLEIIKESCELKKFLEKKAIGLQVNSNKIQLFD